MLAAVLIMLLVWLANDVDFHVGWATENSNKYEAGRRYDRKNAVAYYDNRACSLHIYVSSR